jgi:hypothetical protein
MSRSEPDPSSNQEVDPDSPHTTVAGGASAAAASLGDLGNPYSGHASIQPGNPTRPTGIFEPVSDPERERLTRILEQRQNIGSRRLYTCPSCKEIMWHGRQGCANENHRLHHSVALEVVGKDLVKNKWPSGSEAEDYHIYNYVKGEESVYADRKADRRAHTNRISARERMQRLRANQQGE